MPNFSTISRERIRRPWGVRYRHQSSLELADAFIRHGLSLGLPFVALLRLIAGGGCNGVWSAGYKPVTSLAGYAGVLRFWSAQTHLISVKPFFLPNILYVG
jgi:hypothetical protein